MPGKTLAELSKLLHDTEGEQQDTVQLSLSAKHILFELDGYRVISRLLEGEFLDYRTAIPGGYSTEVIIGTRELMASVDRASLIISDRLRSPLRVRFETDHIKLSCSTSLGKSYDEVLCKTSGNEVEMGFNNKYVLDALKAADCDQVKLQINGPLSPMKVVPLEGDAFLFLVLPVRLKNEN